MAILIEPPQNELSALQNLSDSAGFLKKMGDGNYSIDNNNYLPLSGGTVTNELSVQHISQSGATWTSTFSASGIELGRSTSASAFSLIDFHSGGTSADFAARIRCFGDDGNGENRSGSLEFLASNLSFITGDAYNSKTMTIDANGNVSVNGTLSGNGSELANLNASNIATGTLNAARLPNSGVTAGTYNNSATQVRPFTVDAKGTITSVGAAVTITPAWASINSKPTTLSGFGITDAQPLGNELTAIQALADTAGFLKKTSNGVYEIDNNNYLPLSGGNLTGTLGIKERSAISAAAINSEISLGSNGTRFGIFNKINITNEVLTTNRISYGNFNQIQSSGQNSSSFSLALYGAWNDATTTASGGSSSSTLNVLYGAYNRALHQSSDTIFKHVATTFGAYNISQTSGSTATITTAVGSFNYVLNNNATSTITTAHGTQSVITASPAGSLISTGYLFRGEYGGSGSIANRYGLYIDDLCTSYLLNLQVGGTVPVGSGTAGLGVGLPATGSGNIDASGKVTASSFFVGNNQIFSFRKIGWTAPTGTATRATFSTATVTLSQLAERVKALIDDLIAHGLIGA